MASTEAIGGGWSKGKTQGIKMEPHNVKVG